MCNTMAGAVDYLFMVGEHCRPDRLLIYFMSSKTLDFITRTL